MPFPVCTYPVSSPSSNSLPNPSMLRAACLVLVRSIAALTLAFLQCSHALRAQTTEPNSVDSLTVLVYNFVGVPAATLAAAEHAADQILGATGTKINWTPCPSSNPDADALCRSGWSLQTPALRVIAGENKFQSAEYGYTAIPVYSVIYYQRVLNRAHRDSLDSSVSVLLGAVIAHELGHLLLQSPGHSPNGIMQPVWGPAQLRQALTGKLLFTKSECTRIQSQAHTLARLPRKSSQTAIP